MSYHTVETLWQSKRPFEETNWHMMQNGELCDVTFLSGRNKREIKAHKFILASRSPTFHDLFCSPSKEPRDVIEVLEIEFDVMELLLRFIYTEDCDITKDSAMEVLHGAKKYCLGRLEEKCKAFLIDGFSAENVCLTLTRAHEINEKDIEQKCLTYIMENGNEVINSAGFKELPKAIVRKLIISDDLEADEATVYEACKKWATENCRQGKAKAESTSVDLRNQLGDLLHLIRFPLMTFEEFASSASKDDILTADEKVSIFHCIASKSKPANCKFSMKARTIKHKLKKERVMIKRFINAPNKEWMCNGLPDSISFKIFSKVNLLGVSLFSPISGGQVKGKLILQKGTSEYLSGKSIEIKYSPTKQSEEVLLDKSVSLEPGQLYTLHSTLTGSRTYYGTGGQKACTAGDIAVSFIENNFSQNGTDTSEGQFNYLILETDKNDKQ